MRTDSRLYGIHMKEYPIMSGFCVNIHRKSVEEQGTRVETRGSKGASVGPIRGPLRVNSAWCIKTPPIFC